MAGDIHLLLCLLTFFVSSVATIYHEVAFVESPQYSVALPGDSVYFSCRTNLPSTLETIMWLHNRQPLQLKGRNSGQLTFKVSTDPEVYKKQEGTYQCIGGAQGSQFRIASLQADLNIATLGEFRSIKDETIEVFEVIWHRYARYIYL